MIFCYVGLRYFGVIEIKSVGFRGIMEGDED